MMSNPYGAGATMDHRAIVSMIVFTSLVVVPFVLLVVLWSTRRPTVPRKSHETFDTGLNGAGRTLDCGTLRKAVLRSAPSCSLDLPQTTTNQLCIDDTCLTADDVRNLNSLLSDVDKRNALMTQGFDAVNSRIGQMEESRAKAVAGMMRNVRGVQGAVRDANVSVNARGGDEVFEYEGHRVHVFKSGTKYLHVQSPGTVQVLVVAGGGGGGYRAGAGGGGGGVIFRDVSLKQGNSKIVVGEGGRGSSGARGGQNGQDSSFAGIRAMGGGGGMSAFGQDFRRTKQWGPGSGGSGGGAAYPHGIYTDDAGEIIYGGGEGTPPQGNRGGSAYVFRSRQDPRYNNGGGGGAGGAGGDGTYDTCGDGGAGKKFVSSFGRDVGASGYFGGGGGGGSHYPNPIGNAGGKGGAGGGGDAGTMTDNPGKAGRRNTGGGGGGAFRPAHSTTYSGGDGGSGVVIVRYKLPSEGNMRTGALDDLDLKRKPVAAYGLRRLFGEYAGPQIRVRRGSDDTEAHVYFDGAGKVVLVQEVKGGKTSDDLVMWLGGATGYVRLWYDQSGNAKHGRQDSSRYQPTVNSDKKYVIFPHGCFLKLADGTVPYGNSKYSVVLHHEDIRSGNGGMLGSGSAGNGHKTNNFRRMGDRYRFYWWSNDHDFYQYAPGNIVSQTYDGNTRIAYVQRNDGRELRVDRQTVLYPRQSTPYHNYLGRTSNGASESMDGELYTVLIFDEALTRSDIVGVGASIKGGSKVPGTQQDPATSGLDLVARRRAAGIPDPEGGEGGGYFFIKTASMPEPVRMWVDFVHDGGGYDFYAVDDGYSGGKVDSDHTGRSMGLDIFYPRSRGFWEALKHYLEDVLKVDMNAYVRTMGAVYRTGGYGNYTRNIMRDPATYGTGAPHWRVPDGGPWWLRDSTYSEPNGDYRSKNYLGTRNASDVGNLTYNDIRGTGYQPGSKFVLSTNTKR